MSILITISFKFLPDNESALVQELTNTTHHYLDQWRPGVYMFHQGGGSFRYFPDISPLPKHWLPIEYHFYIWQASPQLSCGDSCQIWMRLQEANWYLIFLTEESTNGALVTPAPGLSRCILRVNYCIMGSVRSFWMVRVRSLIHSAEINHAWLWWPSNVRLREIYRHTCSLRHTYVL